MHELVRTLESCELDPIIQTNNKNEMIWNRDVRAA